MTTCRALMAMADTDGDGHVSLGEFVTLGAALPPALSAPFLC